MKELPFHVATCAWIEQSEWLVVGMEVLKQLKGGAFDLLVPSGINEGLLSKDSVTSYQEAVAWSTGVGRPGRWERGPHYPGWLGAILDRAQRACNLGKRLGSLGRSKVGT